MKHILLSILIGFIFVTFYMGTVSVIFVLNNYDASLLPYINLPVRLPQVVFYYFSPPTAEDFRMKLTLRKIIMGSAFFAANILLYSIPAYFLIRFISRLRKNKSSQASVMPPPPPMFP